MTLVNEKAFFHARSEMHQKEKKKIYQKHFKYTDLGQWVNISKNSIKKPGIQLQLRRAT